MECTNTLAPLAERRFWSCIISRRIPEKPITCSSQNPRVEMQALLAEMCDKENGRGAPRGRKPIGIENIPRLERR